jgi:MFS family permease
VVTKIPRFAFEKFPRPTHADHPDEERRRGHGIGRTFKESLQKCLRSLEIGRSGLGGDGKPWRIGDEVYGDRDILPRDVISRKLSVPNAERIFFIRHAFASRVHGRGDFQPDEDRPLVSHPDQGDRGERLMQWLHASWGVGITLGPFIMTVGLERFHSWRWGYVAVGASQIALGAYFALTAARWQSPTHPPSPHSTTTPQDLKPIHEPAASFAETLADPRVWMSLMLFLVYTGIEATLGYWTYTLLTESRGISAHTAGFWTGGYWATFTVGRILAGLFSRRLGGDALIRTCLVGAALGSAVLAWNPTPSSSLAGVVILGFSIAPVFPGLVSGTRARVGRRHEANTIGMQIGIAGLGAALVPALAGVLARRTTIEIIPVFLLVLSLGVLALHAVGSSRALPPGPAPR